MADEYTPTTGNVRSVYAYGGAGQSEDRRRAQFDRWLAAHDRAVKAEGWDEGYARAKSSHCDASPSAAYCDLTDNNPHCADQIEGANE